MSVFVRFAVPAAAAGAFLVALTGCSSTSGTTPSTTPSAAAAGAATTSVKAADVVAAFQAAGLPASNERDNTANQCEPDGAYKCSEWVTTDDISVGKFTSTEQFDTMKKYGAYMNGDIVLSYAAARTPEADQPKYEAALDKLIADAK